MVVAVLDTTVKTKESRFQKSVDKKSSAGKCPVRERYIALKTNLAGWALGAVNIAAELQVNSHLSVELPIYYSPWEVSENMPCNNLPFSLRSGIGLGKWVRDIFLESI